ncbi:MAG: PilZ domain-containing protein [Candidatus Omnitrophica bacterium]|nr:PilZ domain-containing protein [Candidatus Omnitrophota bacterium]
MKNRRKFPRVNLEGKVMWRRAGNFDNLDVIRNVSEGGLCFETSDLRLVNNDIVQFEFQLPSKERVYSKAKVSWVGAVEPDRVGWQAGAEFQDISDLAREDIRQFVGVTRYGCDESVV